MDNMVSDSNYLTIDVVESLYTAATPRLGVTPASYSKGSKSPIIPMPSNLQIWTFWCWQ